MCIKGLSGVLLFLVVSVFCFGKGAGAEVFTAKSFLTWERENQEFYIHTAVGMAGLIAVKNNKQQSQCIDDWYAANEDAAVEHILDVMRQYPSFHPRGVILAVVKKKCGTFNYCN